MDPIQLAQLALGAALIVGAGWLYVRRGREDRQHGSQSAVLLLAVGLLVVIHGLGLMEYRPSAAELAR